MRFSLIYEAQTADTSRGGDAQILWDIVEQSVLAEQLGFDTIWAVVICELRPATSPFQ